MGYDMMLKPTGLVKLDPQEVFAIHQRITAYENADYQAYMTECSENRAFHYGNQYTEAEITAQQERGQYTLVVNKCRKFINGLVGLLSANQPKFSVVPRGGEDDEVSRLGVMLLDWVWANSAGLQSFRKAVKMAARDNISYLNIVYSSDDKVKFIVLGYDDVVVDPKSRDPLFRDAEAVYIVRWMSVDKAKMLYGDIPFTWDMPGDYAQLFAEQNATPLRPGKIFSADKQYVRIYEGYKKIYIRGEDGVSHVRIEKETFLGLMHAYREYLPPHITDYPVVPVYAEDTDNPYKRGEIGFVKGLQKFINKSYGVTLLNAQLMSNPKIVVRETDIPGGDKDSFEDNYARPGSVTVLTGNAELPLVIQGQPLNTSFFTLYQDAKQELEAATIPNQILGYSDSSERYAAPARPPSMLDVREAVLDSLRFFSGNIESALSQAGTVALQFCRAYLTGQRTIRIVDAEKKAMRVAELNRQQALNLDDAQAVAAFRKAKAREGIPGDEVERILSQAKADQSILQSLAFLVNDTNVLDADVLVVPGSYAPSYQMANLRLAMDLQDRGVVDGEAVLDHAPIDNKDAVRERISVARQQAGYIEQLEEELKRAESEAYQLRRAVADHEVRGVIDAERVRQESIYKDLRAKSYVEKTRQKMETREIIRQAQHDAERMLDQLKWQIARENEDSGRSEPAYVGVIDLLARGV